MDIFGICVVTILAIWGLTDIIRKSVMLICEKASVKAKSALVILVEGKCEQAEYIIRNTAAGVKWGCGKKPKKIVCILKDADSQTQKICKTVCGEYPFIELSEYDNADIKKIFDE